MLNPLNFISKFIKSNNQKELDRIAKIVTKINSLENEARSLKDLDFPKKTQDLKEKMFLCQGKIILDSWSFPWNISQATEFQLFTWILFAI